jgi:putative thioredoxin
VIKEVGDGDFDVEVLERSHEIPVLVDFWAEWCGPCRMLGPVLEQIAEENEGRFELVKLDTDAAPHTATHYGIRSIPAVKLFVGGKVIAEFVGALPGGTIRKFLAEHLPSVADAKLSEGQAKLAADDHAGARAAFEAALALDPDHPKAHLALARLALDEGDATSVEQHVEAIDASTPEREQAGFVRKALVFRRECDAIGGRLAAEARVTADPKDVDAWYALGCCLAVEHQWQQALDAFLESVMRKNKHRDAAAHKAMLTVFGLLGRDHELTDPYQRKLQIYT